MEMSSCALSVPCLLCCLSFSVPFLLSSFFVFLFFLDDGQTVQGAMLVYPRGSCGNTACCLFAHLLVCVSQAGLELVSGSIGALLFSQCNVAWRSFVQSGVRGVGVLLLLCGFFSAKCASSISARFLIYGAHTVCFLLLVVILAPPLP
jgi:hypothetical protein